MGIRDDLSRDTSKSARPAKSGPDSARLSRRELLTAGAASCLAMRMTRGTAQTEIGGRMVIENVDRFRVVEPLFEGVRIVLNALGETYTPAYTQGISGAAFRVAGPCPCAPTCSSQMFTTDLLKLLGYHYSQHILGWTGDVEDAKANMVRLIPTIRECIRSRRPVLLWYAFADTAFEVVTGYDDTEGVFLGRHAYQGPEEGPARAKQTRAQDAAAMCPAFGALIVGEKAGTLDARGAEVAALKEAVRHARDTQETHKPGRPDLEGLAAYGRWARKFEDPAAERAPGDSCCYFVYRSTHRAAGAFLKEIAPKYPTASRHLLSASTEFLAEADALDKAEALLGWKSPAQDAGRNARLAPLLSQARDRYAAAVTHIEAALPLLG